MDMTHTHVATATILLVASASCVPTDVDRETTVQELARDRLGCAAAGYVVFASHFGEVKGVGPGQGFVLHIPPLFPARLAYTATIGLAVEAPVRSLGKALTPPYGRDSDEIVSEAIGDMMEHHLDPAKLRSGRRWPGVMRPSTTCARGGASTV
jgi:hypothetical protein